MTAQVRDVEWYQHNVLAMFCKPKGLVLLLYFIDAFLELTGPLDGQDRL